MSQSPFVVYETGVGGNTDDDEKSTHADSDQLDHLEQLDRLAGGWPGAQGLHVGLARVSCKQQRLEGL